MPKRFLRNKEDPTHFSCPLLMIAFLSIWNMKYMNISKAFDTICESKYGTINYNKVKNVQKTCSHFYELISM